MSETKLLPCPFCGKEPQTEELPALRRWWVICRTPKCPVAEIRTPSKRYKLAAVNAWNTRALTPKQEAAEDLYEALFEAEALVVAWAAHHAMQGCTTSAEYSKATSVDGWHPVHRAIYDKLKAALAKAGRA